MIKWNEDIIKLVEGINVLNFGSGYVWGMFGFYVYLFEIGGIILVFDVIYIVESYGFFVKLFGIIYDFFGYVNMVECICCLVYEINL